METEFDAIDVPESSSEIPKAKSAFAIFMKHNHQTFKDELIREGKEITPGVIMSGLSLKWKSLIEEERLPFLELAKIDRDRYESAIAERNEELAYQQEERRRLNNITSTETRFRGSTIESSVQTTERAEQPKRKREISEDVRLRNLEKKKAKEREEAAERKEMEGLRQRNENKAEAMLQYLLKSSDLFSHFGVGRERKRKAREGKGKGGKGVLNPTEKEGGGGRGGETNEIEEEEGDEMESEEEEEERGEGEGEEEGVRTRAQSGVILTKQPSILKGELRPYQLEGLNWMARLAENGINGILADEMGLGKTLQSISLLAYTKEFKGISGPHLVIVPKSTLSNWMNELARFCPSLRPLRLHGSKEERQAIIDTQLKPSLLSSSTSSKKNKSSTTTPSRSWDVLLTTYEVLNLEKTALQRLAWRYLIIDEAHRLKNEASQFSETVRLLKCENRLLLTGTPLQNNLHELWALLNFLLPEVFSSSEQFDEWFNLDVDDTEAKQRIISQLHKLLRPFMLRRLKADVEKSLPPKTETILFTGLSAQQKELYRQILLRDLETITGAIQKEKKVKKKMERAKGLEREKGLEDGKEGEEEREEEKELEGEGEEETLEDAGPSQSSSSSSSSSPTVSSSSTSSTTRTAILNIVMQLRKCCNHPYLFPGMEDRTLDPLGEHLVKNCGKMVLLDKLLRKMKERGHRVLIFSQMTRMLDILEDYLLSQGYLYCRIDGNTSYEDREERIAAYNKPQSEKFIFLLSTRAGGLGINLQTADTVILYDSDWNPQADLQAQDRAHRIGQKKPVQVFRLVTDETIEVKVVERAQQKLKLDAMVVQSGRLQDREKKLSTNELLETLRFGADKIFRSKESEITDDDIDLILEKGRAKTKEMEDKIKAADKGDLFDFSLNGGLDTQVFEGKDYSRKAQQANSLAAASSSPEDLDPFTSGLLLIETGPRRRTGAEGSSRADKGPGLGERFGDEGGWDMSSVSVGGISSFINNILARKTTRFGGLEIGGWVLNKNYYLSREKEVLEGEGEGQVVVGDGKGQGQGSGRLNRGGLSQHATWFFDFQFLDLTRFFPLIEEEASLLAKKACIVNAIRDLRGRQSKLRRKSSQTDPSTFVPAPVSSSPSSSSSSSSSSSFVSQSEEKKEKEKEKEKEEGEKVEEEEEKEELEEAEEEEEMEEEEEKEGDDDLNVSSPSLSPSPIPSPSLMTVSEEKMEEKDREGEEGGVIEGGGEGVGEGGGEGVGEEVGEGGGEGVGEGTQGVSRWGLYEQEIQALLTLLRTHPTSFRLSSEKEREKRSLIGSSFSFLHKADFKSFLEILDQIGRPNQHQDQHLSSEDWREAVHRFATHLHSQPHIKHHFSHSSSSFSGHLTPSPPPPFSFSLCLREADRYLSTFLSRFEAELTDKSKIRERLEKAEKKREKEREMKKWIEKKVRGSIFGAVLGDLQSQCHRLTANTSYSPSPSPPSNLSLSHLSSTPPPPIHLLLSSPLLSRGLLSFPLIFLGNSKGKVFSEEGDAFLVLMMYLFGFNSSSLPLILSCYLQSPCLGGRDWGARTRTIEDLQRRCDQLSRLIEREIAPPSTAKEGSSGSNVTIGEERESTSQSQPFQQLPAAPTPAENKPLEEKTKGKTKKGSGKQTLSTSNESSVTDSIISPLKRGRKSK